RAAASSTRRASRVTSGPIPSPGRTAMRCTRPPPLAFGSLRALVFRSSLAFGSLRALVFWSSLAFGSLRAPCGAALASGTLRLRHRMAALVPFELVQRVHVRAPARDDDVGVGAVAHHAPPVLPYRLRPRP